MTANRDDLGDLDAILFDIGGTLVVEAPPETPPGDLVVELFAGVIEDLTELARSVRIGAVTNTSVMTERDVRSLLGPCGLDQLLEVVVTSVDAGIAKPDPRPILVAMERMDLTDAARVAFVGNDDVDARAAGAAGVRFVRVAPGDRIHRAVVQHLDLPQLSPDPPRAVIQVEWPPTAGG